MRFMTLGYQPELQANDQISHPQHFESSTLRDVRNFVELLSNKSHRLYRSERANGPLPPAFKDRGRSAISRNLAAWLAAAFLIFADHPAKAEQLVDLPVLSSKNGTLDVLIVARPGPAANLKPFAPEGWVYDICRRTQASQLSCNQPTATNLYGGTRLQLQQGDTLKVRLVNQLPPVNDFDHAQDPGGAYLAINPTNLHTHGLLVSPRFPTSGNPTYGDNVFVLTLNPANGAPAAGSHIHGDVRFGYTDYSIVIPANHPSGMYWFHPHAHGVALPQVSMGLAGMITIGDVRDYVCDGAACERFASRLPVRHILLKDTQVSADGKILHQPDPMFCDWQPDPGEAPRQGSCPGVNLLGNPDEGVDYTGGRWYLTLNGQPYPSLKVAAATGEIWRITSASGSNSYDLHLVNPLGGGYDMLFQVLSIDGVALQGPQTQSVADWLALNKRRGKLVTCPSTMVVAPETGATPVCATSLFMMPSSRAELWVAYRDASGRLVATPPQGMSAVLRTVGVDTGPAGDQWPAVDLAKIEFVGGSPAADQPPALAIGRSTKGWVSPDALASDLQAANAANRPESDCKPLPLGHKRRIFYGNPDADNFGLGYEEVDEHGVTVPGSFVDVRPFDPDVPTVCLTLAPGNRPANEVWELVNLTGETHNFHIHQVRFRILKNALTGALTAADIADSSSAYDNLPLIHPTNPCLTVQAWHNAQNPASPGHRSCDGEAVKVLIPFAITGDFVFHCHILEHEDGGMMARIRVRASRESASW